MIVHFKKYEIAVRERYLATLEIYAIFDQKIKYKTTYTIFLQKEEHVHLVEVTRKLSV